MEYPKVRGKRCEMHLSQEDVAKLLNITTKTYNLKENGNGEFSVEEALILMNTFHCKFEDIFLNKLSKK